MGIAIPQLAPASEDRASGAQIIDGSLKFGDSTNASGPYLSRTGSAGNRKTWTLSCWIKRNKISSSPDQRIFTARAGDGSGTQAFLKFQSTDVIQYVDSANSASIATIAKFRDTGWYHLTAVLDASNTTFSIYINGQQQTLTGTQPSNADGNVNNNILHAISYDHYSGGTGEHTDTLMSQFYFIDGQALGPENFGFTDPLTNTWRPKKYTGSVNAPATPASGLGGVTWSSYITGSVDGSYPLSNCFGGTIGTGYGSGTRSTNPGTITLSIAALNLNVTNVKLHTYIYATPSTFTVNGTTVPRGSGNADQEYVVAVNGQLNTIAWSYDSGSGPYCYMRGIEVDLGDGAGYRLLTDGAGAAVPAGVNGFYLPMDGNSPIGKDLSNPNPINDGTVWSNNISGGTLSGYPATNGFDGNTSNFTYGPAGGTMTCTFSTPIIGTKFEIYILSGGGWPEVLVNGTGVGSHNSVWLDVSSQANGSLSTITCPGAAGAQSGFAAVRVDGVVLVDGMYGNSWTPVNFGGSVTLDNPIVSGALPILNTDGGGNVARPGTRTDANAANLVLALPLVGGKDDVSNQINSGSTTKTTAVSGNAASNSSSSNFYGGSFYFDGTDDYTDNTITALGTRDFTLEFWCYTAVTTGYQTLLEYGDHSSNGFLMTYRDGTGMFVRNIGAVDISNATYGSPSKDMPKDKWHHIALTRESNTAKLFINGKYIGNATFSTNYTATNIRLGHAIYSAGHSEDLNGYIQDLRLYDGAVKYTGTTINEQSFIVPSTSPDILPDTPSGVSGSSKLTKVIDGAVSFDGSGDKLSLNVSDAIDTTDFTVECFVYTTEVASSPNQTFVEFQTGTRWIFGMKGSTNYMYFWRGSEYISSTPVVPNIWNHVAWVKSGTTVKQYLNGIEVQSQGSLVGSFTSDIISIGENNDGVEDFEGFISNVRVVESALYTANFTPPTAPLTNVTNTKLLCCQSNTSATAAAVTPGTITANGDAAATNFNPFNTDINTVRGQETGYATLNPLSSKGDYTFADGNLKVVDGSGGEHVRAPFGVTSGKWYWEAKFVSQTSANDSSYLSVISDTGVHFGIRNRTSDIQYYSSGGGNLGTYSSSNWSTSDTYSLALDLTTNQLKIYTNNILGATVSVTANLEYFASYFRDGSDASFIFNFGQKPFKFPPPDGFQSLNAANVRPETVISRPDQYVSATTYSGNSSSSNVITDLNFNSKPDFVWIKSISGSSSPGTQNHYLVDSVRGANGASGTSKLYSNNTSEENDGQTSTTNGVKFIHNGFELTTSNDGTNDNNAYVAWSWKAGGDKNTFNVDDVGYASASDVNMSAGALNSVSYDTSQNWTNLITFNAGAWNGNGINPFNDDATDSDYGNTNRSNGGYATLDISSLTGSRVISVTSEQTEVTITHAGGTTTFTPSNTSRLTHTFAAVNNPTSIKFDGLNGNSQFVLVGVSVDGKRLINSNITPSNVPSSAPTGASVGTKQGFSIIKHTGTGSAGTLPHGLTQKPEFYISKPVTVGGSWAVYTEVIDGSLDYLYLNSTAASNNSGQIGPSSLPSSGVFSYGYTADEYIHYLWHSVPGLQKFGKYTGNGAQNFVPLDFRPAIVWVKRAVVNSSPDSGSTHSSWTIMDSTRLSYNGLTPNHLYANKTIDEGYRGSGSGASNADITLEPLSNGFYLNGPGTETNANTGTYIYCAWAEAPTFNLYGAQSNAR